VLLSEGPLPRGASIALATATHPASSVPPLTVSGEVTASRAVKGDDHWYRSRVKLVCDNSKRRASVASFIDNTHSHMT
jgi:hypothetical protein